MAIQRINARQQNVAAIQVSMSAVQSIGTGNNDVNFSVTDWTIGTSLTRSGSTVVVGAGISYIRITYNVMTENAGTSAYLYSNIHKNGVEQSQTIDGGGSASFRSTSASRIIPVAQGDVIKLVSSSGTGTQQIRSGVSTYMLVERVS